MTLYYGTPLLPLQVFKVNNGINGACYNLIRKLCHITSVFLMFEDWAMKIPLQDSFVFPISLVLIIYALEGGDISTELSPSSIAY